MELLSFILQIAIPLGFAIWGLKFKGYLAAVAIGPLLMVFLALSALNADPVLTEVKSEAGCVVIMDNATSVQSNYTTTATYNQHPSCQAVDTSVPHNIDPQALTTINSAMAIGILSMLFIVSKRILEKAYDRKPE